MHARGTGIASRCPMDDPHRSRRAALALMLVVTTTLLLPAAPPRPVLIVLSHWRWDFVLQRPRHLMSRLAASWEVVFVEEPVQGPGPARLLARQVLPQVTVVVPQTPLTAPGFHDDQVALL